MLIPAVRTSLPRGLVQSFFRRQISHTPTLFHPPPAPRRKDDDVPKSPLDDFWPELDRVDQSKLGELHAHVEKMKNDRPVGWPQLEPPPVLESLSAPEIWHSPPVFSSVPKPPKASSSRSVTLETVSRAAHKVTPPLEPQEQISDLDAALLLQEGQAQRYVNANPPPQTQVASAKDNDIWVKLTDLLAARSELILVRKDNASHETQIQQLWDVVAQWRRTGGKVLAVMAAKEAEGRNKVRKCMAILRRVVRARVADTEEWEAKVQGLTKDVRRLEGYKAHLDSLAAMYVARKLQDHVLVYDERSPAECVIELMHWARRGCPLPKFREGESPPDVEAVKALLEDCVPPRNDIGKTYGESEALVPLILSLLVEDARRVRDLRSDCELLAGLEKPRAPASMGGEQEEEAVEDAEEDAEEHEIKEEIEEKETPENLNAEPSPEEPRVRLYLWALGPSQASSVVRRMDSRSDLVSPTPEERTTWQQLFWGCSSSSDIL